MLLFPPLQDKQQFDMVNFHDPKVIEADAGEFLFFFIYAGNNFVMNSSRFCTLLTCLGWYFSVCYNTFLQVCHANIVQVGILLDNGFRLELSSYEKEDQMANSCASW